MVKPIIAIILGTRPEAIKLAPVIQHLQTLAHFETKVILTGQHREMVAQVMDLFNLKADRDLDIMQPHQTLGSITRSSLEGLEGILQELQPSAVIIQGDTTTAFAGALAAFYQQIPVGHVEAGLRTDNLYDPFPEEANRRLISQLAQFHFAPTELAVENLNKSGVTGTIYLTGNTVIDALVKVSENDPPCPIAGLDWTTSQVILATVHRRENWGTPLQDILQGFTKILDTFPEIKLLLPLHRNPTVREPIQAALGQHPRVFLTEPLNYEQLVGAIQKSYLLLTDSGGLQEEAPTLGKPVLVLRETTERPEAIAANTAKLIGTNPDTIFEQTQILLTDPDAYDAMARSINPFGDGQAAIKIGQILTDYFITGNDD